MYVEDLRGCISILRVCHMMFNGSSEKSNNSNNNTLGLWGCKPFEPTLSEA
jgi:hypothetical protein